jgi:hypothetical protein
MWGAQCLAAVDASETPVLMSAYNIPYFPVIPNNQSRIKSLAPHTGAVSWAGSRPLGSWEFPPRDAHRDPGVLEGLGGCDAFGWVDGQHLIDQVLGFWRDRVPFW